MVIQIEVGLIGLARIGPWLIRTWVVLFCLAHFSMFFIFNF